MLGHLISRNPQVCSNWGSLCCSGKSCVLRIGSCRFQEHFGFSCAPGSVAIGQSRYFGLCAGTRKAADLLLLCFNQEAIYRPRLEQGEQPFSPIRCTGFDRLRRVPSLQRDAYSLEFGGFGHVCRKLSDKQRSGSQSNDPKPTRLRSFSVRIRPFFFSCRHIPTM